MKKIEISTGLYIRLMLSMIALTVMFTVSGVLAWFSDTETVINVVKTTGLIINVHETGGNYYEVLPGATVKKDPRIANVSPNKDDVYIRVEVELCDFRKVIYTPFMVYDYIELDGAKYEMNDIYGREYTSGETIEETPQLTEIGTSVVAEIEQIRSEIANGAPKTDYNYKTAIFYVNVCGEELTYDEDATGDARWWSEYEDTIYQAIKDAVAKETLKDDGVTPAWYYEDGYWYYNSILSYDSVGEYFFRELAFDGNTFGDEYQSVYFKLPIYAEAVQAKNFFDSSSLTGNEVGMELAKIWPD